VPVLSELLRGHVRRGARIGLGETINLGHARTLAGPYPATGTVAGVTAPIRMGVLGAARITPTALITPARAVDDVSVVAMAARDPVRAATAAARWQVPRVLPDYAAVIDDPEIDAVYLPLPNSLHAEWTLRAIAAGKHVLCEKPLTSNAAEAVAVAEAADGSGLVVMEAFHYRYTPLMRRVLGLIGDGAIGAVRQVRVSLCFPLPRFSDIRYRLDLAGGALMDAGCYTVHCLRQLGPGEPAVVSAQATMLRGRPGIDRAMRATFLFPSGATGEIVCSLWSRRVLAVSARVIGDAGELTVFNFVAPQVYHHLSVRTVARRWRERVPSESSYTCQLRAFADGVLRGRPVLTPASDAVVTMGLIDDIYRRAGLEPR
jgi:predicted dehydrogenase